MSHPIVFSTTAAFIAFLFFSIPAQADEIEPEPVAEPVAEPEPVLAHDGEFARNGIYLGVALAGAVYTEVEDDLEKLASVGYFIDVDVEVPPGLDARVGYRFHPHLAGEVQIQWFPKADIEFFDVNVLELETLTFTGNVKGYLLTGRIQPFLLVGAGLMHFDVKDKVGVGLRAKGEGFAARFGGGVDFYINSNVVFVLEGGYVLPTGDVDGLDYASFSFEFQYRF
jgi:opacity protein-like surface antigen